MSLIECAECGHKISSTANRCVSCGWLVTVATPSTASKSRFLIAIFVGFIGIYGLASILTSKPKPKSPRMSVIQSEDQSAEVPIAVDEPVSPVGITSATVIYAHLQDVDGEVFREVVVAWKNTGTTTIRAVDAKIVCFDRGLAIEKNSYTIYACFDSDPGIRPGETKVTKAGEGFRLRAYSPADSVDVQITKVLEKSGM